MNAPKQKGITVLELLVAVGILSVVTGIGLTYYVKSRKNLREVRFVQVMRVIAKRVEKLSQNPEAIAFSAAQSTNSKLANCVWTRELGSGKDYGVDKIRDSAKPLTNCDAVNPNEQQGFNLYVPPKKLSDYELESRKISGGANYDNGVWYDVRGKRGCDPDRDPKRCIIQVKTYFWATCPRGANDIRRKVQNKNYNAPLNASCYRAQSINIRYQVRHVHRPRSAYDIEERVQLRRQLPNIPRDKTFWLNGVPKSSEHTPEHASPMDVAQLGRYSDYTGSCGPNYTLIEVKDSIPNCKCLPPYREKEYALSKVCVLEGHKCRSDERYMGTRINGEPICEPVVCEDKTYTLNEEIGFVFDCGPYGWLNAVRSTRGAKNCNCKTTIKQPNLELGTFREACDLHCSFTITCCRRR